MSSNSEPGRVWQSRFPDTLRARVLDLVRDTVAAHGHGLTLQQIQDAYARRYPAGSVGHTSNASVREVARTLRLVGALQAVVLTRSHVWYAPVEFVGPVLPHDEPYAIALRFVQEQWDATRVPPDTHAVSAALQAAGARRWSPVETHGMLVSMCTRVLRPRQTPIPARLRELTSTRLGGARRALWIPGDADPSEAVLPDPDAIRRAASRADGAREVVRRATTEATFPLTRLELTWWCDAHATDPVVHAFGYAPSFLRLPDADRHLEGSRYTTSRQVLSDVARRDAVRVAREEATAARLRSDDSPRGFLPRPRGATVAVGALVGPLTTEGGPRTRYYLRTFDFARDLLRADRQVGPACGPPAMPADPRIGSTGADLGASMYDIARRCRLLDFCAAFVPGDEVEGLDTLCRTASYRGGAAGIEAADARPLSGEPGGGGIIDAPVQGRYTSAEARLLQAREAALRFALRRFYLLPAAGGPAGAPADHYSAGAGSDREALAVLRADFAAAERLWDTLDRWIATAPLPEDTRYARRVTIREARRHAGPLLAIVGRWAAAGDAAPPAVPPFRVAGDAALISLTDVEVLARAATEQSGTAPDNWRNVIMHARRFPRQDGLRTGTFAGEGGDGPRRGSPPATARLDRVDALCAITLAVPAPRAHALVTAARRLLGWVLRDADFLRVVLSDAVSHGEHPASRRALVVALALLGELAPAALAMPDRRDPADANAYTLAAVLATGGVAAAVARALDEAEAWADDGHEEADRVLDRIAAARRRVRAGGLLSIIG